MECPNCHQATESGAAFCGNCGQALAIREQQGPPPRPLTAATSPAPAISLPTYAAVSHTQQASDIKLTFALILGISGIAGSLFAPIMGLALGVSGVVLATITPAGNRKTLARSALALGAAAVLAGLAAWTYNVQQDPRFNTQTKRAEPASSRAIVANELITDCYSLDFIDELNISRAGNCDMEAFNGRTLETSTNVYKIYATQPNIADVNTFMSTAKSLIEKDVAQNATGFSITRQRATSFAGKPAYVVNMVDKTANVSVVEAAVMSEVPSGENVFVLVHANNGPNADLQILEAGWRWK